MKHIFLAIIIFSIASAATYAKETTTPVKHSAITPSSRMNQKWWKERYDQKMKQAQDQGCEILFLGDSITHGWDGAGKNVLSTQFSDKKIINFGMSGDRTEHTLWLLTEGKILDNITPKLITLMIGTNNVGHGSSTPEQAVEGVQEILRILGEKKPNTPVMLYAVFPRGADEKDVMRKAVEKINKELPSLADGNRIFFVSINEKLLEPDGKTLSRKMMPDLLHPAQKGYEIWAEALKTQIKEHTSLK